MTREFVSYGPFEIPFETNHRGAKHIGKDDGRDFFAEYEDLGGARGCCLFAIRNGGGLRAAYVGKACRSFRQEVFAVDKLQKLNTAVHTWTHGTPVVLFAVAPPRASDELITEVERFLIQSAKRVWPELLNIHHSGDPNWAIRGVTVTHVGQRSDSALAMARMLRLD